MAMAATKQNMAPELRSPPSSDDCGGDLSGEFDARCRISVHYASTAAMDGNGNGKREEEVEDGGELQTAKEFTAADFHLGILFD